MPPIRMKIISTATMAPVPPLPPSPSLSAAATLGVVLAVLATGTGAVEATLDVVFWGGPCVCFAGGGTNDPFTDFLILFAFLLTSFASFGLLKESAATMEPSE